MEIKLREAAITEAISDYMKKTGILSPLTDISYSIERKNNAGLTAMVELGGPEAVNEISGIVGKVPEAAEPTPDTGNDTVAATGSAFT
jgi:hypothetical protein